MGFLSGPRDHLRSNPDTTTDLGHASSPISPAAFVTIGTGDSWANKPSRAAGPYSYTLLVGRAILPHFSQPGIGCSFMISSTM